MILDVASQSLIHARGTVRLTQKLTAALAVIADAYPNVATREAITSAVWPGKAPKNWSNYRRLMCDLRERIWVVTHVETSIDVGRRLTQPIVVIRDWRDVGAIVPRSVVQDLYAVLDLSQSKKRAARLRDAIEVVA